MRYLGMLGMAAAFVGAGFLAAETWKEKLMVLGTFRQMAYHLKGRILYANEPLPEALSEVGGRFLAGREGTAAEPGKLFLRISRRLETEEGCSFAAVWKEELERMPETVSMDRKDRQALASLGESLGYADRSMQERTLLFYVEQTDDSIGYLKKEMESRVRLYRCLGMAAGLFLLVILA